MNFIAMWLIFLASFLPQDLPEGMELVDQLLLEHIEWIRVNYDEDYPVYYSYYLTNFNRASPDMDMLTLYEDVRDCARDWPAFAQYFEDVPFREVRWYLFDDGWSLNTRSHVGAQIGGVVFAAKHIAIARDSMNEASTVVHEIMHALYPSLWHKVEFYTIVQHCINEVW